MRTFINILSLFAISFGNNNIKEDGILRRVSLESYPLATCNDGTPAAYYIPTDEGDTILIPTLSKKNLHCTSR